MKTYIVAVNVIDVVKYAVNAESENEAVLKLHTEDCFEVSKTCLNFSIIYVKENGSKQKKVAQFK